MGKLHLKQIKPVIRPARDRDQLEDFSKQIIGVAIKIDFSWFRTFVVS